MQALIIDVAEPLAVAQGWVQRHGFTFPVLWDESGDQAARYAPEGLLPDLPRYQVPIGGNLLIDREGIIRFYTLLDTRNFDARLVALRGVLDSMLASETGYALAASQSQPDPMLAVGGIPAVRMTIGNTATTSIPLIIREGFHVQANPAGQEFVIPLRIRLDALSEIETGDPVYPQGETMHLMGSEFDLSVYGGTVNVELPLTVNSDPGGDVLELGGMVYFQGCNQHTCFPPDSVAFTIPIEVAKAARD